MLRVTLYPFQVACRRLHLLYRIFELYVHRRKMYLCRRHQPLELRALCLCHSLKAASTPLLCRTTKDIDAILLCPFLKELQQRCSLATVGSHVSGEPVQYAGVSGKTFLFAKVLIGGVFGKIVSSVVADVFMPVLGI